MPTTVLVIDDNELIRALVSRALSEAGFIPFAAPDGPRALEFLESHVFDLIIVDYVMPQMLGDEFIRRVRSHKNPAVRRIPVLGLSGSHKDAEALFINAGATAYIRKPLQDEPLLAAVHQLLAAGEARRQTSSVGPRERLTTRRSTDMV